MFEQNQNNGPQVLGEFHYQQQIKEGLALSTDDLSKRREAVLRLLDEHTHADPAATLYRFFAESNNDTDRSYRIVYTNCTYPRLKDLNMHLTMQLADEVQAEIRNATLELAQEKGLITPEYFDAASQHSKGVQFVVPQGGNETYLTAKCEEVIAGVKDRLATKLKQLLPDLIAHARAELDRNPDDAVLKIHVTYLEELIAMANTPEQFGYYFGVSKLNFANGVSNEQAFMDINVALAEAVKGVKQASLRKQQEEAPVVTSSYAAADSERSVNYRRSNVHRFDPKYYATDLLRSYGQLLCLENEAKTDQAKQIVFNHFFIRNEEGELELTPQGAVDIRRFDHFKHTDIYRASPDFAEKIKKDAQWLELIEFADFVKMVPVTEFGHYRAKLDRANTLRRNIVTGTVSEEELCEAIKLGLTSHKEHAEEDGEVLTDKGFNLDLIRGDRPAHQHTDSVVLYTDAIGLGGQNKIAYDQLSRRIVKKYIAAVRDLINSDECFPKLISFTENNFGVPLISNVLSWIECEKYKHVECGDHYIFIGKALKVTVNNNLDSISPLVYYGKSYKELK